MAPFPPAQATTELASLLLQKNIFRPFGPQFGLKIRGGGGGGGDPPLVNDKQLTWPYEIRRRTFLKV